MLLPFLLQGEPILESPWINVTVAKDQIEFSSRSPDQAQKVSMPLEGKTEVRADQLILHGESSTTTITLDDAAPFAYLETQLHNRGNENLSVSDHDFPELTLDLGVSDGSLCTLGTGGRRPNDDPQGSYTYHVLAHPQSRKGIVSGWLTQARGVGLLLPSHLDGKDLVQPRLDFGQMRIPSGESRDTDTLAIGFFADVRIGLEQYADLLAEENGIQLPKKPNVYCTWYHRNLTGSGASNEKMILRNAEFARDQLKPFGLDVFQIDDHWQALESAERQNKGPVKTFVNSTEHYSNGMAYTAEMISREGFTPGIWIMPFAGDLHNPLFDHSIFATDLRTGEPFEDGRWSGTTIDASNPDGKAFLRNRFERVYDWGYRYIKIDGLHIGMPSHNIYVNRAYEGKTFAEASIHDPDLTFVEAFRKGLEILREETPGTFILGCSATQNMVSFGPSFGFVDAMRVGPDNDRAMNGDWTFLLRGPDYAGNLWFLNNRVWYNDPDPIFVRESNPLHKARWMASWLAVSGAMNTTSMQYSELSAERLDLLKRTLPAHDLPARPVDILEKPHPEIWKVANERITVLCLLNWDETNETRIDYRLDRMGLESGSSYDVFDFWENRYLGTISDDLTASLPGAHCQVLALRKSAEHPQVLSTSRHITQGLMDIVRESWDASTRVLSGTSRVVADDPYELRITCPPGFVPAKTHLNGFDADVTQTAREPGFARVTILPAESGVLHWSIDFNPSE